MSPEAAVAGLRNARTAASTKATYRAAEPLYEASCLRGQLPPWPPSRDSLELFAGYLRESAAFAAPGVYFWGIVESARARGHELAFPKAWFDGVAKGLERDLPEHEQAAPLTVPLLRRLAASATSQLDFTLVLSLAGAIFCAARSDCFLHLRPEDIQDVAPDKVRVVLRHLKGEVRREVVDPVFDRLAPQPGGSEFADLATPLGPVRLCPVAVFRALRDRALAAGERYVAQCKTAKKLSRRFKHLFGRAQIELAVPGRDRALYSMHSTRVAAVCYLLKAGLSETVVSVLCNWSSDQVRCYGRRLALDPSSVGLWPFYNPASLAGAYAGAGSGVAASSGKRKRGRGA